MRLKKRIGSGSTLFVFLAQANTNVCLAVKEFHYKIVIGIAMIKRIGVFQIAYLHDYSTQYT